ncbi:Holliday junction branch migration protein RuvA [Mangrovicoccus algicola]|uniref:Holliday junction branch migration complex subunit RuvA n=1 Tax=Mangrovicoccus algicola TaxID=2771008 RepID=A0A8J7CWF3_9RHOB|nr:Holliday junction branch migration protein RuvA [Mangrovicoccus algicola]MBE3637692.1 Holliday junction branch migration protein RuvA [Mangrovicoccus algicola]
MIGRLSGQLVYRATDHVMIDVQGVGYLVYCAERTLAGLPAPGEMVSLYTDMLVREDLLQLFGFRTLAEKEWYRLLCTVQGVGAKAALAILSALGPDGTGRAITLGDANAVRQAQGVGPKLAQRIVMELKDKAANVLAMSTPIAAAPAMARPVPRGAAPPVELIEAPEPLPEPVADNRQADAISALVNLGYSMTEAATAVARAAQDAPEADTAQLIRAGLKSLMPNG